jgi:hypothetical protein
MNPGAFDSLRDSFVGSFCHFVLIRRRRPPVLLPVRSSNSRDLVGVMGDESAKVAGGITVGVSSSPLDRLLGLRGEAW